MGTVTGYTAERMKAIEDASVVNGDLDANGHLILTRFDESTIDAGLVTTSPKICTSETRPTGAALFEGLNIYETDTKREYVYDGTSWVLVNVLGAWPTWVPVLTQGAAFAKTVNRAAWSRRGRSVEGDFYLTATAAGTPNNKITVSLPVAAAAGIPAGQPIGVGFWYTGTTTYQVNLCLDSPTTVAWYQNGVNSPLGASASTDGTAVQIGGVLCGSFRYEAAASA